MTLTADLLSDLIESASTGDNVSAFNPKAILIAEADLAAMRTPITAEALTAAGWVKVYDIWLKDNDQIRPIYGKRKLIGVEYVGNEPAFSCTCRTMHDLAELVRLLGGGA